MAFKKKKKDFSCCLGFSFPVERRDRLRMKKDVYGCLDKGETTGRGKIGVMKSPSRMAAIKNV